MNPWAILKRAVVGDDDSSTEDLLKNYVEQKKAGSSWQDKKAAGPSRSPADLVYDDDSADMSPRERRALSMRLRDQGNPDYFEESLRDDNRLGENMAKELYANGQSNPWDIKQSMTQYSRDLGLDREELPIQTPYLRPTRIGRGPPLKYTGDFGTTQFVAPNAKEASPFSIDQAHVEMAPDLTPAEQLLTARHELQHVKEFDQSYKQRGPDGVNIRSGLEERYGSPDHFIIGDTPTVESGFVNRPWMLR